MSGQVPLIEVNGLTKKYGEHRAVDGISFTVNRGEVIALLGPNGAGKSTTMKMLTCFIPATSGDARVAGFDIWNESLEVRRTLGYMPENMPLYTDMRVREYLDYRARLKGVSARVRKKRVEEVAARCWIDNVIDRIIGQLSKGYRQRVGLAESLIHNPQILILDEPTIGLDPSQIRETRKLIAEVGEDRTVILSTHILPEAEMISNRVMIINAGQLIPEEVVKKQRESGVTIVEVAGGADKVKGVLSSLDGIESVKQIEADPGTDALRFEIEGASNPKMREAISRALVEADYPAIEIRALSNSLEDVFVRIISRDNSE